MKKGSFSSLSIIIAKHLPRRRRKAPVCMLLALLTVFSCFACAGPGTQDSSSGSGNSGASPSQPAPSTPVREPGGVEFSPSAGFYAESSLEVTLSTPFEGDIYYTTDCSAPSADNPNATLYREPISVRDLSGEDGATDRVTVIRAAVVKDGAAGQVFTCTYLLNSRAGDYSGRYENLPVFSISTDDAFLFGPDGIYTNFTEHGRETERIASIEFFEAGGSREIALQAGMRIYGGTSRSLAQKSIKITARKEYGGEGKFSYPFFPDNTDKNGKRIEEYDTITLRAGGNDSLLTGDRSTQLRDALVHTLAKKIDNLSSQAARPTVVYLNGKYWGLYFLREDLDNDYIESHYKTPKENIAILTYGHENGNWFYKLDEGTAADEQQYKEMLAYIAGHNMQNKNNYEKACEMLDMDNFVKYMAVNIYVNNRDWPHNNVRMWRYTGTPDPQNVYTDGKWRYMLKDVDYSWGRYYSPGQPDNVVATETAHNREVIGGGGSEVAAVFASLLRNKQFKDSFMNVMCDIKNVYYSFASARDQITAFQELVTHEMPYQMSCTWNGDQSIDMTVAIWKKAIENTLLDFAEQRPDQIELLIRQAVSGNRTCTVTVKIENGGGKIVLCTLDLSNWKTYMAEYYQNTDVRLSVLPYAGHTVAGITVESPGGTASYEDGMLSIGRETDVAVTVRIS